MLIAAGFLMVFAGGYLLGIKGYRAQIDAAKKFRLSDSPRRINPILTFLFSGKFGIV